MEACDKFNEEFSRGESVEYTDSVGNVYQCTIDLLAHCKHGHGALVTMTNQHGVQMLGDPARVTKKSPAQILVEQFNSDYPVGSPVKIRTKSSGDIARLTSQAAFVDSVGDAVVFSSNGKFESLIANVYRPDLKTTYG